MLDLISIVAIVGALVMLAVWSWGRRHSGDARVVEGQVQQAEPSTQYMSLEDMFAGAEPGASPPVADSPPVPPTMVLKRPASEVIDELQPIPATEFLSRDEASGGLEPASKRAPQSTVDALEEEATKLFSRDMLSDISKDR